MEMPLHQNKMKYLIKIGLIFFSFLSVGKTPEDMAYIKGGSYEPLYALISGKVEVPSFYIDKYPVTNYNFQQFLAVNPEWNKENIKPVFADENYLKHWKSAKGNSYYLDMEDKPVVYVSWYAAKAYCAYQGKTLPTIDEWEYVARASETKEDASNDDDFLQRLLSWYGTSSPNVLSDVGKGFKNVYGVYDMHGLVWEWNLDFLSALSIKDSRDGNNLDEGMFCGAGAGNSKTPKKYTAFMRYATRSSLKANFCQPNLGFRCIKEIK